MKDESLSRVDSAPLSIATYRVTVRGWGIMHDTSRHLAMNNNGDEAQPASAATNSDVFSARTRAGVVIVTFGAAAGMMGDVGGGTRSRTGLRGE